MDGLFKKSNNVFDVVSLSLKEPYRYDKHGQLKDEFLLAEAGTRRASVEGLDQRSHRQERGDEVEEKAGSSGRGSDSVDRIE